MIALVLGAWLAANPDLELHVTGDSATAIVGKLVTCHVDDGALLAPIDTLHATLNDAPGITLSMSDTDRNWTVFVPVPVDSAPGVRALHVEATTCDGVRVRAHVDVTVKQGDYPESHVTIDNKFMKPDKASLARAARESRTYNAAVSVRTPERLWRGSFVHPTAGAPTSVFGAKRTYNGKRHSRHMGLDLDGNVGDLVVAANRGRVVLAEDRFYSGGTVVIDHGQGLLTTYFHMSRIDVKAGELVTTSQPIGLIGATGQVTGPHLHFQVHVHDVWTDPAVLLALDLSHDAMLEREPHPRR